VSSAIVPNGIAQGHRLLLAAASVGVLASLALAGPIAAQSMAPAGDALVVNSSTTDLGTFLVDAEGRTLYYFVQDTAPGVSACEGECLTNWPALTVEGSGTVTGGEGVTGWLAAFPRSDGTLQVAYRGRPLYYFAGDTAPGDTNGQGRGDNWYVAAADGTMNGPATPTEGGLVVNSTTTDLGTFLTDADGRTLYIFTVDTVPGASNCDADCLATWPAFGPAEGQEGFAFGEGVTGVLGSFTTPDGLSFATYDGRPLYYFVGDQAAGDTNGEGIGGVWFVAHTDGHVPAAEPEAPAESMAPASPTAIVDRY
jgi:predicted lipoprotein with Yx(FWY)xxD motif